MEDYILSIEYGNDAHQQQSLINRLRYWIREIHIGFRGNMNITLDNVSKYIQHIHNFIATPAMYVQEFNFDQMHFTIDDLTNNNDHATKDFWINQMDQQKEISLFPIQFMKKKQCYPPPISINPQLKIQTLQKNTNFCHNSNNSNNSTNNDGNPPSTTNNYHPPTTTNNYNHHNTSQIPIPMQQHNANDGNPPSTNNYHAPTATTATTTNNNYNHHTNNTNNTCQIPIPIPMQQHNDNDCNPSISNTNTNTNTNTNAATTNNYNHHTSQIQIPMQQHNHNDGNPSISNEVLTDESNLSSPISESNLSMHHVSVASSSPSAPPTTRTGLDKFEDVFKYTNHHLAIDTMISSSPSTPSATVAPSINNNLILQSIDSMKPILSMPDSESKITIIKFMITHFLKTLIAINNCTVYKMKQSQIDTQFAASNQATMINACLKEIGFESDANHLFEDEENTLTFKYTQNEEVKNLLQIALALKLNIPLEAVPKISSMIGNKKNVFNNLPQELKLWDGFDNFNINFSMDELCLFNNNDNNNSINNFNINFPQATTNNCTNIEQIPPLPPILQLPPLNRNNNQMPSRWSMHDMTRQKKRLPTLPKLLPMNNSGSPSFKYCAAKRNILNPLIINITDKMKSMDKVIEESQEKLSLKNNNNQNLITITSSDIPKFNVASRKRGCTFPDPNNHKKQKICTTNKFKFTTINTDNGDMQHRWRILSPEELTKQRIANGDKKDNKKCIYYQCYMNSLINQDKRGIIKGELCGEYVANHRLTRHSEYCQDLLFGCPHCNKSFTTKNNLRVHKQEFHEKTEEERRVFRCPFQDQGCLGAGKKGQPKAFTKKSAQQRHTQKFCRKNPHSEWAKKDKDRKNKKKKKANAKKTPKGTKSKKK